MFPAFTFEGKSIKTYGTFNTPFWIAEELCAALKIDPTSAVASLDPDATGVRVLDTPTGRRRVTVVFEPGLYELAFTSRTPAAVRFQKWLLGEVLPSIAKHKTYPPPAQQPAPIDTTRIVRERAMYALQIELGLPHGYWCLFTKIVWLLHAIEPVFGTTDAAMPRYDRVDDSVHRCWTEYRRGKPWAAEARTHTFTFPPGDRRGTITTGCYRYCEYEPFDAWVMNEYLLVEFPEYLRQTYGEEEFRRAVPILIERGVKIDPALAAQALAGPPHTPSLDPDLPAAPANSGLVRPVDAGRDPRRRVRGRQNEDSHA